MSDMRAVVQQISKKKCKGNLIAKPQLVNTGCKFNDETKYCGQDIWTANPGGGCWAWDASEKDFVEVEAEAPSIIAEKINTLVLTRSFTCEVAAIEGPVKVDNAYVFAQLEGGLIANCYPANDPLTVTLHEFEATLAGLGDQTADGFESTSCQAVATDLETGKTKDLEPGGSIAYENTPGYSVPQFCIELAKGSVLQLCGVVSVVVDKKTNQPVPIPTNEIIKNIRSI